MVFYVFKVKKILKFLQYVFLWFWQIFYKAWSGSETLLIKKKKDEKIKLKKKDFSRGGQRKMYVYRVELLEDLYATLKKPKSLQV